MKKIGVIVPAAGVSSRMQGQEKLFADLAGKPVLAWCVDTFESCADVVHIIVAMNAMNLPLGRELARKRAWKKCSFCVGGARRQDSVAAALSGMDDVDCVVVHDGDRPFVTVGMIEAGVSLLDVTDVAVAAVTTKDTIKEVDGVDAVVRTLDRSTLRIVQTPQVLRIEAMRTAYRDIEDDVTDDAMLAECRGYSVKVYEGSYENIKITTPEDLVVARLLAERRRGQA
ncbi:MAG: 2-C-methyl-D-erythritol 4-phosphate cytidylyltransferase [Chloroflexota bacterium]